MDNPSDFDALANGAEEYHVIPDTEAATSRHTKLVTFFAHFRVAREQVALFADGLQPSQRGIWFILGDICSDILEVGIGSGRVDHAGHQLLALFCPEIS